MPLDTLSPARRAPPAPPAGGAAAVIGTAIRGGWRLSFLYDGLPRVVDPHLYGVLAGGELAIGGMQVDGERSRGPVPAWDTFRLAQIEQLQILDVPARVHDAYDPEDPAFEKVYAQA